MTPAEPRVFQALVVRAGERVCAIPLSNVEETMRPLPIAPLAGTAEFVCGVALIRGVPTPVVDLKGIVEGGSVRSEQGRLVTLNVGERRVALAVDAVIGVRSLRASDFAELAPLLRDASSEHIEALAARDAELLVVLRAGRLVPDQVWEGLRAAGVTR